MGEKLQHAIADHQTFVLGFIDLDLGLQNAQPQFVIGGVQVNHQAALQAGFDPVLKVFNLAGGAVGGNDDLFLAINKGIEGVEKLFLGAVFASHELHIINHQHIDRAEQLLEIHHPTFAQGIDKAVHELLG